MSFGVGCLKAGHERIVERAQGIEILVLFVLGIREKSQKVRVGRVCEHIAHFGFHGGALDLRLFDVLVVPNLGGCSKTDDLLHAHRRHLRKAIEELLVLRCLKLPPSGRDLTSNVPSSTAHFVHPSL